MLFQPKGLKRKAGYDNLPDEVRRRIEVIAAVNDVSKAYVKTTLLAKALNIHNKDYDYETYTRNRKRTNRERGHGQIRRIK